jgi:Protein of unknown function (DUF4240)
MAKIDVSNLGKVSEVMDEDQYWALVEKSLKKAEDQDEQEEYLIKALSRLSPKEMIGFRLRTDKLLYDTYTSEMWCAGYLMNGGCSDDGFEYFRNWVISRGKKVYYAAKENPDSLIDVVNQLDEMDEYEFEAFWYVAYAAFENRTGLEPYTFIDYDDFITREDNYSLFEFTWKGDKPESMKAICPRLFEHFWEG